jgi:LmbE family N-acetylglucosaminyl deacetylase
VLAVVAHPDDCEFSCGGAMARCAAAGADVRLVVVTDGSVGSHDPALSDAELSATREAEQRRAADLLGIGEVTFLGERDGAVAATPALVDRLVEAIRAARPELVITHDPFRHYMLHPDHISVGAATWRALYSAREPRLHRDLGDRGLAAARPAEAWLFSAEEPDFVLDISDFQELRERAILCHDSQKPTSMGFSAGDAAGEQTFRAQLAAEAARVGAKAGFRFGEEYRRVPLG